MTVQRITLLILFIFLTACGGRAPASATPTVGVTPSPTSTIQPTATQALTPTLAGQSDPAAGFGLDLNTRLPYSLNEGGFSFKSVGGFLVRLDPPQAVLWNVAETSFISMATRMLEEEQPASALIVDFIGSVRQDILDLVSSAPYPVTIGGVEALASDISGTMSGSPFKGQVVLALVEQNRVFYASAIGIVNGVQDAWQAEGQPAFGAILDSIEFFEPMSAGDACEVSTDETYGYSTENPIRVGGELLEGPLRERSYLEVLRGPNGEAVTYERTGSDTFGEEILDIYTVTYPGLAEPVTLYIDMYGFSQPLAPLGFTCSEPFSLGAP